MPMREGESGKGEVTIGRTRKELDKPRKKGNSHDLVSTLAHHSDKGAAKAGSLEALYSGGRIVQFLFESGEL